jgi:hypothetical protein
MKELFLKRIYLVKLLSITTLVLVIFFTDYYWKTVCYKGGCNYYLIDSILEPLFYGALSLLTFALFFLPLPPRYLKYWLIGIFSWGLPLSYILVKNKLFGTGPFPIDEREVIILLTGVFWLVTLIFIGAVWWLGRKKNS